MSADPSSNASPARRPSTGVRATTSRPSGTPRPARKRVYVKVAMPGISGVVSAGQLRPGSADYEDARHLMTHDLNAVLDGAFRAGAVEAVVYDAHAEGRNVNLDALDERALVIAGRPEPQDDFFYGLDESFAALFLVGFRARAQAPGALLAGTYADDIVSLQVNETEVGEIGMEAALAGKFGVPLALLSGDSAAVQEVHELLGDDVETVQVKKAVGAGGAICLSAARAARLLREAAERAFIKAPSLPPVVFQAPTTLQVVFRRPESAAALARVASAHRAAEDTVRIEGSSVVDVFRTFVLARGLRPRDRLGRPHSPKTSTSASA